MPVVLESSFGALTSVTSLSSLGSFLVCDELFSSGSSFRELFVAGVSEAEAELDAADSFLASFSLMGVGDAAD